MASETISQPAPLDVQMCGEAISYIGAWGVDEAGHRVGMFHADEVHSVSERVGRVMALHSPDYEGLVAVCGHCRLVWPCPTREAVS